MSSTTDPQTTGPISGGNGQANAAPAGLLAAAGYIEEEYFFGGEATSYTEPATQAAFRSRMIVRRPAANDAFSGVAVVEWLNVTAGSDGAPHWEYTDTEIMREGHAWVGVSAQQVGVMGGNGLLADAADLAGGGAGGLVGTDPERYGQLNHPGDAYSFNIFNQAAAAVVSELQAQTLIAAGESQSATYLATHINEVHPSTQLFHGFMVHSRLGSAAPIDGSPTIRDGGPTLIRTDGDTPVLQFVTETDLTVLNFLDARQPDNDRLVTWEVAGTAHADLFLTAKMFGVDIAPHELMGCPEPINDGPHHQTVKAALHHLIAWVVHGTRPPSGDAIEHDVAADGAVTLRRDDLGNVVGGIRTPAVDVPVSALNGERVPGANDLCALFGSTATFDQETLARLYPTQEAYAQAYAASLQATVDAGHILEPEAQAMSRQA